MPTVRTEEARYIVVQFEGRIDATTAPDVEQELAALVGRKFVVADLTQVRYVSSAGLRVMLKAAKQAKTDGFGFAVCGLQPAVREVFEVSGFDRVVPVFATAQDAVTAQ